MKTPNLESLIQEEANKTVPHMPLRKRSTTCHHCGKEETLEDTLMETANWCHACNCWVLYHATCWFERIHIQVEVPHHHESS